MRIRYLPPGSMRRQRRLGRLEGSVFTLVLACAIGAGLIAAAPAEIYKPAAATVHPAKTGKATGPMTTQIPPCVGAGKDCSALDDEALLPRNGPTPLRRDELQENTVPEPGTLALIGAGLAAMMWRKS